MTSQTDVLTCHSCSTTNPRKKGRHCACCSNFYHLSCAKLTQSISASLPAWKCPQCLHQGASPSSSDVANLTLPSVDELLKSVSSQRRYIPLKIPKGARISAASALADTIEQVFSRGDDHSWSRLFCFASSALILPQPEARSRSLTSSAKEQIVKFLSESCVTSHQPASRKKPSAPAPPDIRRLVNAKLVEGDISAAVRVVTSDDSLAPATPETLTSLRSKHPPAPDDLRQPPPADSAPIVANEEEVLAALMSFRPSSSGGVDGLRPSHIKDLCAKSTAEAGRRLRCSLVALCNLLILGEIPPVAHDLFFSASLTALRKKDGGIRPIAVGNTFRRLAAKIVTRHVVSSLSVEFSPIQLGVGIPGGCEAAAHAARAVFPAPTAPPTTAPGRILVKLDMKNAFNSLRRDHMLEVCHRRAPSIYRFAHLSYSTPSLLVAADSLIPSTSGVQQGDPLGPLLFALAVDDLARSVSSPVNFWYLDDATIGGPCNTVVKDLQSLIPGLASIGLEVNPSKSEIINIDSTNFERDLRSVRGVMADVKITHRDDLVILGSPINRTAIDHHLTNCTSKLELMAERLSDIDTHPALFLLKNCLAMPRLLFALRASPSYLSTDLLSRFDDVLRRMAGMICNSEFDDHGWTQASLPTALGGLGLPAASDIALPAYASSFFASRSLIAKILDSQLESLCDREQEAITDAWSRRNLPVPSQPVRQRHWSALLYEEKINSLKASLDQHRLACLAAAAQPRSGAWLNALPSSALGCLLDNDSVRIGVAVRLGLRVCQPHQCRCGVAVDSFGLHPLSCRLSAGRLPRHKALNEVVKRALDAAGLHSLLEPAGLDRGDGKRPDGITIFPFESGKSLVWDATCGDTFAPSSLLCSATDPGWVARAAEERKFKK